MEVSLPCKGDRDVLLERRRKHKVLISGPAGKGGV